MLKKIAYKVQTTEERLAVLNYLKAKNADLKHPNLIHSDQCMRNAKYILQTESTTSSTGWLATDITDGSTFLVDEEYEIRTNWQFEVDQFNWQLRYQSAEQLLNDLAATKPVKPKAQMITEKLTEFRNEITHRIVLLKIEANSDYSNEVFVDISARRNELKKIETRLTQLISEIQ